MTSNITVVMPTYRHAEFIVQSLESVFRQTLPAQEIVVINDGSPDDTEERIAPYMSRVTYVHQEHNGISKSLNRGLAEVKTDYVLFLASDDWLDPSALAVLKEILDKHHGVGVAHANRVKVDEYLRPLPDGAIPHMGVYCDKELMLTRYSTYTPPILCRTRAVLEAGAFPDFPYCQDWALWISIALSGWHFYGTPEVLGYYRRHGKNTSHTEHLECTSLDEIRMLSDFIRSGRLSDSLVATARHSINHRKRVLAWLYVNQGKRAEAMELFKKLARTDTSARFNTLMGFGTSLLPRRLYNLGRMSRQAIGSAKASSGGGPA